MNKKLTRDVKSGNLIIMFTKKQEEDYGLIENDLIEISDMVVQENAKTKKI